MRIISIPKANHLKICNIRQIIIVILLSTCFYRGYSDTLQRGKISDWKLYSSGLKYLDKNPDSTYQTLSDYYKYFKQQQDTIPQIKSLLMMSDLKKNKGDYNQAYDHTWDALILAETKQDTFQQAECHVMLGLLYGIFYNYSEALKHNMLALEYRKLLLENNKINELEIIRNYFSVGALYSRAGNFEQANTYLDTCTQIAQKNNHPVNYIFAEKAYIAIMQNKLDSAEKILKQISPHFIGKKVRYEVVVRSFWGDLKMKQGLLLEAEKYYLSSLEAMNKHNVHTDFRPEILQKLANIYAINNKKGKAYFYLQQAKQINDSLFSAKNNSDFLEIRNTYKETIQEKDREIIQQQILLDEKKDQNFRLKVFLVFIVLIIVSSILLIKIWLQRKQYKEKQHRIKFKAKLEKEKHEEVIEVKNKEITSYTLQLINKERIISDLLQKLEQQLDAATFRAIRNQSKDFNKNLWKEFNERFTHVNSSFYSNLQIKYPTLSPTDLKYCALIKLNFNGNEMAQLLNLSLPSVHIARHRIRKKFGLQRKDNLTKFLNEI